MIKELKDVFIKNKYDSYGRLQYRNYLKLSDSEKRKIENLKNRLGENVKFKRGSIVSDMIIMAVTLPDKTYTNRKDIGKYRAYPYQFRLNYSDYKKNTKRMWDGIWTSKINNVTKK